MPSQRIIAAVISTVSVLLLAAAPATKPATQPSAWGIPVNGLKLRLTAPPTIEENDFLQTTIEFAADPSDLPSGITLLDTDLYQNQTQLQLRNTATNKTFTVQPFDASSGMPSRDDGKFALTLDNNAHDPLPVMFPLRSAAVPPGEYECSAAFTGKSPPNAAGFWQGKLATGPVKIIIQKETPKNLTFFAPKALHLDADKKFRAHGDDLETISLPIGNGLISGCVVKADGAMRSMSGMPTGPKDPNLNSFIQEDPTKTRAVTVTVFVTGTPPAHFWSPSSDKENYREVWTKTYTLNSATTAPKP